MKDGLRCLHPFQTPKTRRLAVLFAVAYFAQRMHAQPNQVISIGFKEQGLGAGLLANLGLYQG